MPSPKHLAVLVPAWLLTACAGTAASHRPLTTVEVPVASAPAPVAEPVPAAPEPWVAVSEPAAESPSISDGAMLPLATRVLDAALEAARLVVRPMHAMARHWAIVQRAVELVGERNLRRWDTSVPNDCSGFVRVAYSTAGIDLVRGGFIDGENAVSAIFRLATRQGAVHHQRPRPGDLVFFRETYDRNRDGRRNDGMTHIGVVERVESDGTVTFIHRGGKGVARSRMNLEHPTTFREGREGPVLNDYIRPRSKRERAYLAGELFAGFASAEGM